MARIKSYTDLEQSKKLAKILPLESADMSWILVNYGDEAGSRHEPSLATYKTGSFFRDRIFPKGHTIPCWSLAALLNVIRETIGYVTYGLHNVYISCELGDFRKIETKVYDNEVDTCVAMIEKLHKLKML